MKYLVILTLFTTGCVSKLVKHNRLETDSPNEHVQPIAPFNINPEKMEQTKVSAESYNITNDVAIIIGLVVLVIGFLPLILSYIDYITECIKNWYNSKKNR